jgi:hypothetical protein
METIPDTDALAPIPMGRPSDDLEPVIEWRHEAQAENSIRSGARYAHAFLYRLARRWI